MAQPRSDQLITALDIGSWKVSALIAERLPSGDIQVLGTGQRESRGVKRGYIADMDATESAVRDAVEQAERIAGTNIEDVWVGFSAGGLVSDFGGGNDFMQSGNIAAGNPRIFKALLQEMQPHLTPALAR